MHKQQRKENVGRGDPTRRVLIQLAVYVVRRGGYAAQRGEYTARPAAAPYRYCLSTRIFIAFPLFSRYNNTLTRRFCRKHIQQASRFAKQHAKISDTNLAALEKHDEDTEKLKRCQSLCLTVASEVATITHSGDRTKLRHAVQDVSKDIEDWRVVAWLVDGMTERKPSDLEEILQAKEIKFTIKHRFAKRISDYNQTNPAPRKTKKPNHYLHC